MEETWQAPLLDRLEEMQRRFFRHFHSRIEAEGGLSPSQFFLLKVLECSGTLTVSDLAQRLGTSVAGATGLIDRLVRAGLVDRTRDEADRRVVRISLSPEGIRQMEEAHALRRRLLADFYAPLSQTELEQLVTLYEKAAASLPVSESECSEKE